ATGPRSSSPRSPSPSSRSEHEAGVEQERGGRDERRGARLAETREGAARGRDRDAGQDQRVAERPAPQGEEGDGDDRERPERVAEDGDEAGGDELEVLGGVGNAPARDGARE